MVQLNGNSLYSELKALVLVGPTSCSYDTSIRLDNILQEG